MKETPKENKPICAACGEPSETGLHKECERELLDTDCVFEARDYSVEGRE